MPPWKRSPPLLPVWTLAGPAIGWLLLAGQQLDLGNRYVLVLAVDLVLCVLAAVDHAEVFARRVGEPYGTLILGVAITVIEVALIVSLMVAGGAGTAELARDTVFATVMIILNGIIGVCLLVGGTRFGEQSFGLYGVSASLAALAAIVVLTLRDGRTEDHALHRCVYGGYIKWPDTTRPRDIYMKNTSSIRQFALLVMVFCVLAVCLVWTPASAQPFPNKPVRIILPLGTGSPSDLRARQIAAAFPEVFGQPLVVDNRPGASGFIAAEAATRAPADGYTLFMGNFFTHAYNPWLFRKMPYRDVEDFTPITLVGGSPLIMAVNPQLPVRSFAELVALAKAKPGELNYGVWARTTDVVMHQIKRTTGINVVGVPYKTAGADLTDTIAGHVQITFNYWSILEPLVKAGKLRAIAVAAPTRLAAVPDLPTFAEAGAPGVEMFGWVGIFALAGTPPEIVERLQKGLAQILHAPALRDDITRSGAIAGGNSTQEFAAFVRADRARTGQALTEAGIAPE